VRSLHAWSLGLAVLALALAPSAAARTGGWAELHRPLRVPHLAAGGACPVSHPDRAVDFARFGVARGLGPGPAYPVLPRGVLVLGAPQGADAGSPWKIQKVLWFVHPRYAGPVLVRGRRLDGAGLVRFGRGLTPATELRIPAGGREQPSYTRLRSAGCYAYQVDGLTFSRVVIFRAT
jgi:hypothetical protein